MEWILVIVILVVIGVVGTVLVQQAAQKAYQASLERLRRDPTNSRLRQETLALGRKYANMVRNFKGVAIFDEVALMNDLNAAAGGTMAVARGSVGNAERLPSATVEQRLQKLADLRRKELITEEDFRERKSDLLAEL